MLQCITGVGVIC